jgi:hypothetical protein
MMDPTQAQGAAPAGAPLTICISMQPDGSFKVYQEDEAAESNGGPQSDPSEDGQSAPDIDSALDMARSMLTGQADPGAAGQPAAAGDSADDIFQAGFNKVRGNGLNGGE